LGPCRLKGGVHSVNRRLRPRIIAHDFGDVSKPETDTVDFVSVGWTYASTGGADFGVQTVHVAMVWKDDVGSFAHVKSVSAGVFSSALFPVGQFFVEHPRVNDHAVTEDKVAFFPGDAGRKQVEFQNLFAQHHGVACVVAALKTSDPGGLFGQTVNEFPFSFIAPLGA
jgi:hypothetical protein